MLSHVLLYAGAISITLWGIAHIAPTRQVVAGFGTISEENRRIITMEWVSEGLTLCFIGALALLMTVMAGPQDEIADVVYRGCGVMLLLMAAWTLATGARTSITAIKLCPVVKAGVAILLFVGSGLA